MSASLSPNSVTARQSSDDWRQNLGRVSIELRSPRNNDWWTGMAPSKCPGVSEQGKLHSLPLPNLATCSRMQVLDYFNNTWTLSELLYSSLIAEEAFYRPPYHQLRHPMIFYYGHAAVLYINKFRLAGLITEPINQYFETLFETGVDEMSWDDMSKNYIKWPSIDETLSYRRQVYATIVSLIESHPGLADEHQPILPDNPLWALFMGLEHERIHLETSSVLIRELPVHLLSRPQEWPDSAANHIVATEPASHPAVVRDYPANTFIEVSAKTVRLGKPLDWPSYGWDNEYGNRTVSLSKFAAGEFLISNGEYWQFVSDGGYDRPDYWSETGWRWRSFRDIKCPTFWVPQSSEKNNQAEHYLLRTCFEVIPMQWDLPVIVNFHEASAFSLWKSKKDKKIYQLITEAQHQALRHACNYDNTSRDQLAAPAPLNVNLRQGSESAVNQARNENGAPFCDLFGNIWQWCEDHFNPLEGTSMHRYYEDFSTPCYDGQHQMILGGSFISTGDEASPWARFHFRPHFFQHAGIRLVHVPDGTDGGAARI